MKRVSEVIETLEWQRIRKCQPIVHRPGVIDCDNIILIFSNAADMDVFVLGSPFDKINYGRSVWLVGSV